MKERESTYVYQSRKPEANAEMRDVRGPDGGLRCDAREELYALSLVLRGSHGFQAGIFSADRQRGRNGRTQAWGERRRLPATARVSSDASPHLSVRI